MANHPQRAAYASVRRKLARSGHTKTQIAYGLAYAKSQGAVGSDEVFTLAVSRILYTDDQLADGALFSKDPR